MAQAKWLGARTASDWAANFFTLKRVSAENWVLVDSRNSEPIFSKPMPYKEAQRHRTDKVVLAALAKLGFEYDGKGIPQTGQARIRLRELIVRHGGDTPR